uniref:Secreted protein n=1 Tax=Rhipicephalus appendiculatus TaxID=34631 RepID=A0A131YD82_RHIAP
MHLVTLSYSASACFWILAGVSGDTICMCSCLTAWPYCCQSMHTIPPLYLCATVEYFRGHNNFFSCPSHLLCSQFSHFLFTFVNANYVCPFLNP